MHKLFSTSIVATLLMTSLASVASASTAQVAPKGGATLTKAFLTLSIKGSKPGPPTKIIYASKKAYLITVWSKVTPPATQTIKLYYKGIDIGGSTSPYPIPKDGTYAGLLTFQKSIPTVLYGSGYTMKILMNGKVDKNLDFSIEG